jgi:hypothetical protein
MDVVLIHDLKVVQGILERLDRLGRVVYLELFRHEDRSHFEVGPKSRQNIQDPRDIVNQGDIDSFDLGKKRKPPVSDNES